MLLTRDVGYVGQDSVAVEGRQVLVILEDAAVRHDSHTVVEPLEPCWHLQRTEPWFWFVATRMHTAL